MRAGTFPEAVRRACALGFTAAALAACGGRPEEVSGPPPGADAAPPAQAVAVPAATAAATGRAQASAASADAPAPSGDAAITREVRRAFLADAEMRHATLAVHTLGGVVTLRGNVGSAHYAERALALARTVPGVADVRSEVSVSLYVPARSR
jgi:hyperosmotically inducible protein